MQMYNSFAVSQVIKPYSYNIHPLVHHVIGIVTTTFIIKFVDKLTTPQECIVLTL